MSELKKLLHADPEAETFVYEIEHTAEHLTVARLVRDAGGGTWKYAMTAQRLAAPPVGATAISEVKGEGHGFTTLDDALAAARDHARLLLAGGPQAIGLAEDSVATQDGVAQGDDLVTAALVHDRGHGRGRIDQGWIDDRPVEGGGGDDRRSPGDEATARPASGETS